MSIIRKLMLVVLSVCFFLGIAAKAETEVTESKISPEKGTYEPLIKPEEEPALYKTEIKQITPKSGIATGHVIAYGHYIKPPYKVEIKSDTMLFINGVQIFPVLPSNYEIEKKRREKLRLDDKYGEARIISKPYRDRLRSLFKEMSSIYELLEPRVGKVKALDSIYKMAIAETLIVKMDTTFVGKDDCMLSIYHFLPGYDKIPEDTSSVILILQGGNSSSGDTALPVRNINTMKEHVINMKEGIERVLNDQLVIFYTSKDRSFRSEHYLWETLKILKSDTLNMKEKIEKLSRIINENAAKELLYNFYPSEWPTKNIEDK
jgi:hypothetical protein